MKVISANNAGSALAASITAADTSLTLTAGTGAAFPAPTAGFYATLTIVDQGTGLIREIMWYTARTGDVISGLQRGKEGTTARDWAVYDFVANLWTAGQMAKMAQDPSDQLGGVSAVQSYAGNPNGNVAGNAAVVGVSAPSAVWDTTNKVIWTCTTTGTTSTAVWTPSAGAGATAYAGTATGTANALVLTTPIPVTLTGGVSVSFVVATNNSSATTANVSGTGAVAIRKNGPGGIAPLTGGELVAGNTGLLRYDGTFWHLEVTTLGTASRANSSSNTGIVAAITGAIVAGHVPIFTDNAGTIGDGGPAGIGGAPFPLTSANNGQTFGPGVYFANTSAGAFSITLSAPGAAAAGSGWTFIDQLGTWATNNFTVNAPGVVNFVVQGITFQTLAANTSGWEFTVESDGTNLGML